MAIRGDVHDGHRFVEDAALAGAGVIVIDRDVGATLSRRLQPARSFARAEARGSAPVYVRVADGRSALAGLAAACYGLRGEGKGGPRLIGITGTNGKTTVSWLLRSILQAADRRVGLIGTIEYDLIATRTPAPMTTPGPLDLCRHLAGARDAGATDAVLEVSSHALDQRRCDGLSFSAGVFTTLSGDHLDYHKTMEAYAQTKRRLFDELDADAVAVVSRDDSMGEWMVARSQARVVTFGLDAPGADVRANVETMDASGSSFVMRGPSFEQAVRCSLLGRHNVMNALAAATAGWALGITPEAIRLGLERVTHVPGRLQRVDPPGCPFTVLVDYAHTDDALTSVLNALRPLTRGRLVCVFGCGGDRDRSKRPRMAAAVAAAADTAYVTSDNPRTENPRAITEEILKGFVSACAARSDCRCRLEVEVDRRKAIAAALSDARPGDTVLITGKGHETYQLVGDKVLPFDDVEVVRACLEGVDALEGVT